MEHPDEGTIHAWLDEQLDEAHAAELDAHVASCASCRAVVAEARGYMASATRILGALDDVPAGVVPPPSAADVVHIQQARERRKRWQWLSAAAGLALMVTGGTYVLRQTGSEMNPAARSAANLQDEIAETAARERTAAPPAAPAPATARGERSGAVAPQVGNASGATSAEVSQRPPAAQQDMRAGRDSAPSRAAATALPPTVQADVARTTPPPPPPTAPTVTSAVAAETRMEMSAAKVLPGLRARQGLGFVASDATTAFVGCYSARAARAETGDLGSRALLLPTILQLTDSSISSADGPRFVAIDPAARERVLRWSPLSGTAIRLVIGDSANAPTLTLMTDSLVPRLPLSQVLDRRACPQE